MKWDEVRQAYPNKWVVLEAIDAYSKNDSRIIKDIAVLDYFADSMDALRKHDRLHKQEPDRELYFFHTSRENLDIHEKKRGLRKI